MSSSYARIKQLFLAALDVPAEQRAAFVDAQAAGDLALRDEVRSLLAHEGAPVFREPAPAPAPEVASARADPIGAVGAVIDGRYRVIELVDEGGFSYVYRGEQLRLRRPVALKFFNEHRSDQRAALERAFINEGALLGELSRRTTTIPQAYDAGTWSPGAPAPGLEAHGRGAASRPRGGEAWLFNVLEWLDGETLARRLAREREAGAGGWSIEQVLATLEPIADALAIAFDLGIAHRDVKPGNVFLATVGDRSVPKLLDFGTAKVASAGRPFNSASSVVGVYTMAYAAPEQLARTLGPTGPWTDVYALALLCVELLLGRPPFTRADLGAMARRLHTGTSLTPHGLGLALPAALEGVLATALATAPQARFPEVRQFWSALRAAHHDGA